MASKEGKMKFLITQESKYPIPPEISSRVLEGMMAWLDKYQRQGKLEASWSIAGRQAGGGILNVNSLEELDEIMTQNPLAPFSDVRAEPLSDARESLQRGLKIMEEMFRR
jgi:muconolactone delta-isomerase